MKVTVICKGSEWQVEQLKKRAKELAIDLEMQNIENSQALPHNLGEVVLWRSSSLGVGKERLKMMGMILEKHILINRCLMRLPHATEKAFQQSYVQEKTKTIPCISTFQFSTQEAVEEALREGILRYPFIQKPDKGSKGQGVELITDKKDLERVFTSERPQVYQNFIRNSGDYRVLVLGGRMLGAIKRTATEGNFLNNISKGGVAKEVTDPQVLSKLRRIATTIASIFELTFCGVDVIYDEATKKYFFLEVNTVPQWKGFQTATGIDVAGEILSYCQRLVARKEKNTFSTVYDEYHSQVHLLRNKQFHFLSRLYAWTEKDQYKVFLDALRKKYIGATTDEYRETLKNIFSQKREHGDGMVAKALREKFFTKYPSLEPALDLLFKYLFAKKIYAVDLRPYIQELVKKK